MSDTARYNQELDDIEGILLRWRYGKPGSRIEQLSAHEVAEFLMNELGFRRISQ